MDAGYLTPLVFLNFKKLKPVENSTAFKKYIALEKGVGE
jgi:hypothetical protein